MDLHFCSNKILLLLISVIFIFFFFFYWLQTFGKSQAGDRLWCELNPCVTVVGICWFLPSYPSIAGWAWEWDWPLFPRVLCPGESLNDDLPLHETWPRMHLSSWDPFIIYVTLLGMNALAHPFRVFLEWTSRHWREEVLFPLGLMNFNSASWGEGGMGSCPLPCWRMHPSKGKQSQKWRKSERA